MSDLNAIIDLHQVTNPLPFQGWRTETEEKKNILSSLNQVHLHSERWSVVDRRSQQRWRQINNERSGFLESTVKQSTSSSSLTTPHWINFIRERRHWRSDFHFFVSPSFASFSLKEIWNLLKVKVYSSSAQRIKKGKWNKRSGNTISTSLFKSRLLRASDEWWMAMTNQK